MLERLVQDYNAFAFDEHDEWDETEATEKKTAHDEAERMFMIMFRDLPQFADKTETALCLQQNYDLLQTRSDTLLAELVQNYQSKLDGKYTRYYEAGSISVLKKQTNALISSSAKTKKATLWPLVRQVR